MTKDKFSHISDDELLQRFLKKNEGDWLGILLQRYTLLLLGVCMKYLKNEEEAKDAVQQIFLKTLQEVHKYKIDYFKSWLYMVAKNHCLSKLRDNKNKYATELTDKNNYIASPEQDFDLEKNSNELSLELLNNALEELNMEQKQCVTLFYLRKNSYQQICEITGYSLLQVKSYIQNGKRNLKINIEKKLKQAQQHV